MGKRVFEFRFYTEGKVELDDQVIDAVDDNFRKHIYDLETVEDVVEMIVRNMIKGADLSQLDGWANQPNKNAKIIHEEWELDEINELEIGEGN